MKAKKSLTAAAALAPLDEPGSGGTRGARVAGVRHLSAYRVPGILESTSFQKTERVVEASEQRRGVMLQVERSLAQAIAEDATTRAVPAARRHGVVLAVDWMRAVREQFAASRGSLPDMLTAQATVNTAGVALADAEVNQVHDRWRVFHFSTALAPLLNAQDGSAS